MSIASAIQTKQQQVAAAYIACDSKGATIPATPDLTNLATCIGSISSGGGTKYGVASDNVFGNADQYGILQNPTSSYSFALTSDVTNLSESVLQFKCASSGVTHADLSSLTSVSGKKALHYFAQNSTNLLSLDMSNVVTISGESAVDFMVDGCTGLIDVCIQSLTSVSGLKAMYQALARCTSLVNLFFMHLENLSGSQCMSNMCAGDTDLEDIYFPALDGYKSSIQSNAFSGLLANTGTTKTHTLHFRDGLQTKIQGLSGYPNFGGSSGYVNIAYDLGQRDDYFVVFKLIGDVQNFANIRIDNGSSLIIYTINEFKNNYLVITNEFPLEFNVSVNGGIASPAYGRTDSGDKNTLIEINITAYS